MQLNKILLISINAKFIHSNLAIRCIKKYCEQNTKLKIELAEFTINQQLELIMREIYKLKPDILGISCYIWNYEYVSELVHEMKKIMPECIIILGGPEVSYDSVDVIAKTNADYVIMGEGEHSFCELVTKLEHSENPSNIRGIACKGENEVIVNEAVIPLSLDEIPFAYDENFSSLKNRIIYYETSRGCPFSCQYCLSSGSGGVRFLSKERIQSDISRFLKAEVPQVKFVDRTFNCNKEHAMSIINYILENDNKITNFHFEIAAELLDDEMISALNTARKGLFQLEIGVQSTNEETLKAIKRITLPQKLTPIIKALQKTGNMHLHLDLIAGLPYEDYNSFKNSFNYVYSLSPDQLQLGFLKLLKGSGLYADKEKYGLTYKKAAPYEILFTKSLNYDEVLQLKMIEEMVETYYNSGRYKKEIAYLSKIFDTPFDFFERLASYYETGNMHLVPHSKVEYYDILYNFAVTQKLETERYKWLVLYDLYESEKAKKLPNWLDIKPSKEQLNRFYDFIEQNREKYFSAYVGYDSKQILRMAHFQEFPFNPLTDENKKTTLLFTYEDQNICEINP